MHDISTLIKNLKELEKNNPVGLAYISGRVDALVEQNNDKNAKCSTKTSA